MQNQTLPASDIQVLPDPIRGWLKRQENQKPEGYNGFWPATDEQGSALDCPADILMLGGSAGSLKTSTLLADAIQERDYPRMNSYFFRATYPELEDAIQQAYDLFPATGASGTDKGTTWKWPSGAHFRFRHLSHEKNLYQNQGKAMSTIAIDESTHILMEWIRYLVTRNRSTDSNLKIRLRLGTNPGNLSSREHMKMFFNDVCPHCEPGKAPPQGVLRWGTKWHDGVPLRDKDSGIDLSISYILSSVRDHNLLGPAYIARLKMQKPAIQKALLAGCWRLFEGVYYDFWKREEQTVPRASIGEQYWWSHWVGADYGYSGSAAAAVLMARSPEGVIYCLAEYPVGEMFAGPRENVRDFAQAVYKNFAKREIGQEMNRNLETMYLGPDSWNNRGDDHTLAGQMNAILEEHGLEFIKANNDRAGGAQLLYTMLQSGQLKIADTCHNVIGALETRLHDPKEPVKVLKVPEKTEDDVFDAVRYAAYSYMEAAGMPTDLRIQERMKKIVEKGGQSDMAVTTAVLQYEKIRREESDDEPTVYVGGSARRRMQEAQRGKRH